MSGIVLLNEKTKNIGTVNGGDMRDSDRMKIIAFAAVFGICMGLFPLDGPVSYAEDNLPQAVVETIEREAMRSYPSSDDDRQAYIDRQKRDFHALSSYSPDGVDPAVIEEIKISAAAAFPHNFSARKFFVEAQIRDYLFVRDYWNPGVQPEVISRVRDEAFLEFPEDYSAQKLILEKRISELIGD
ncbi:MAG: hypothetical protein JXO48_10785 [Deltaproteobacteria bacterium]|nr:hypothetical protein [Deltaproteobacteria bacterium]